MRGHHCRMIRPPPTPTLPRSTIQTNFLLRRDRFQFTSIAAIKSVHHKKRIERQTCLDKREILRRSYVLIAQKKLFATESKCRSISMKKLDGLSIIVKNLGNSIAKCEIPDSFVYKFHFFCFRNAHLSFALTTGVFEQSHWIQRAWIELNARLWISTSLPSR